MTETPDLEKPPLTPLRWFFAIVGGLLALYAGGCGLFYTGIGALLSFQGDRYGMIFMIIGPLMGGVPALIGWLIWWAAVKRGRKAGVLEENGAAGVN